MKAHKEYETHKKEFRWKKFLKTTTFNHLGLKYM